MFKKALLGTTLAFSVLLPFTTTSVFAATSKTVSAAVSDTAITGKIKALYAKSAMLKSQKVSVTTIKHRVALAGQVKTNAQYERAIILAESVKGVKHVIADDLTVKSSDAPLSDTYITAKVKSKFLKEKLFGTRNVKLWPVKVETKDAIVYLTGSVDTVKEQTNLLILARQVKGVQSVKSAITVK